MNAHPNANLGELGERLPTYSLLDYERDTGVGVAGYVVDLLGVWSVLIDVVVN